MKRILHLTILCLLLNGGISAQVTIGSLQKPVSGALLDLKEEGATSKGMLLPRVKLGNMDKLKMGTNEILDADNGGDQYKKHTGLLVYHVSGEGKPQCAAIPDGMYAWDGANWQPIGVTKIDQVGLKLNGGNDNASISIPSGHDKRGTITNRTVDIDWTPADLELLLKGKTDAAFGGLRFAGNPLDPATSFSGGSKTYSIHPDIMPTPDPASPWQSRETTFEFKVDNECGFITRYIIANQTHYAIQVDGSFDNKNIFIKPVVDADLQQFALKRNALFVPVIGNARWRTNKKSVLDPNGIMSTVNAGSYDVNNGGVNEPGTRSRATVTMRLNTAGTKYGSTMFTIYDNDGSYPIIPRYDDVTVNVMSCLGTVDDSGTVGKDNTHKVANILGLAATTTYDIPSGRDARGTIVPAFNLPALTWTPAATFKGLANNVTVTNTLGKTTTPVALNTALPNSLATQSQVLSVSPKAMTVAETHPNNPWFSKESVVKFEVTDDCDETSVREVVLNQTNYALQVNGQFVDSDIISIKTAGTTAISVKGNAEWKATILTDPNNTINSPATINGGRDIKTGATENTSVDIIMTDVATNKTKYGLAKVNVSDSQVPKRFDPIVISTMSCLGSVDNSGVVGKDNTHKIAKITTTPNVTYFDVPSGRDARPLTTFKLPLSWTPVYKSLMLKSLAWGSLPNKVIFANSTGWSWPANSVQPQAIDITPVAMTVGEVTALNPWYSKESIINLETTDDCGESVIRPITVNQTNYALEVNGSLANTTRPTSTSGSFDVKGNSGWRTYKKDPMYLLTTNMYTGGSDLKNSTTTTEKFEYTLDASTYRYAMVEVTFTDVASPKRFNDITVTLDVEENCLGTDPTLVEWKDILGTNKDVPHSTTKAAWHTDQNNNIFFSGDFGGAGRWMTTNLAATKFDPIRTRRDTLIMTDLSLSNTSEAMTPYYSVPSNTNNRMGLLYNWGGMTAQRSMNQNATDGEQYLQEDQYSQRQGACPNGWHVPSNYEWTELENEIVKFTSKYSSRSNIGGVASTTSPHGAAMKDICEPYTGYNRGTSFNFLKGGFSVLLNNSLARFGTNSLGHKASYGVYIRSLLNRYSTVSTTGASTGYDRTFVRCKRDEIGVGEMIGKKRFDVVMINDNTTSGRLVARQRTKHDFSTNDEVEYIFKPMTTISNLRFEAANGDQVVAGLSYPTSWETRHNLTGSLGFTVKFKKTLNNDAAGKNRDNPIKGTVYAVYNQSANGKGPEVRVALNIEIMDSHTCGLKTKSGGWLNVMCHNLGSDESLDPFVWDTSKGLWDGSDIKGDLYQWGRPADGHQKRNSATTSKNETSAISVPGHGNFILVDPRELNWLVPEQTGLWGAGKTNDPCPTGWKVPSNIDWNTISFSSNSKYSSDHPLFDVNKSRGYYADYLYLPYTGEREPHTGAPIYIPTNTYYRSGNYPTTDKGSILFWDGGNNSMPRIITNSVYDQFILPAAGYPIRCIAE